MNLRNMPIQMTQDWVTYDLLVDVEDYGTEERD